MPRWQYGLMLAVGTAKRYEQAVEDLDDAVWYLARRSLGHANVNRRTWFGSSQEACHLSL